MRRLSIMVHEPDGHFTLWNLGPQEIHLAFDGGRIVSDAGLLAVRALEKPLGVIAGLARRLPDPRAPKYIEHSVEALLTQQIYQLLAGYPDSNDADELRDDPLFQILADVSPDADKPLASGSTLARFEYAFTRRQAELPPEDRPVLLEQRAAQCQRITIVNDYLVELFIATRRTPPTEIILDVDASDDPVHGQQALSGYHGYYRQHQYLPLFVYDGVTGFPLAAWLRPGTVHASLGVTDILDAIVTKLRAAWPGVPIRVRSDNGLAVPALYEYCERQHLPYAFGYATNPVLQRATAATLADLELYYHFYGHREPHLQHYLEIGDYQADSWPHPRRIVAKLEITPQGSQQRFVVTDFRDPPVAVYRDFYVQRGRVPEQPIGEMKNGLRADRLSSCGFCANAFRLMVHTVAYAIVVLFREAVAGVPEVATATVSTLRQRWWKVGAVVVTGMRRIWLHLSESWPGRGVWGRVLAAVRAFVGQFGSVGDAGRPAPPALLS
jgi:Transposase DDE domain group 1